SPSLEICACVASLSAVSCSRRSFDRERRYPSPASATINPALSVPIKIACPFELGLSTLLLSSPFGISIYSLLSAGPYSLRRLAQPSRNKDAKYVPIMFPLIFQANFDASSLKAAASLPVIFTL